MNIRPDGWQAAAGRAMLHMAALAVVLAAHPGIVEARQVVIPDAPECTTCRVEIAAITTLSSEEPEGLIPEAPTSILVDSNRRIWFVQPRVRPMVFAPDGRFLQSVGGRGEGPGEFQAPWAAIPAGDSVAVYDVVRRTISIFGPDLEYTRTVSAAPRFERPGDVVAVDWPTAIVFSGFLPTPDHVGWPLHVADASETNVQTGPAFGEGDGVLRPDPPLERGAPVLLPQTALLARVLATGSGDEIWSIDPYTFTITGWSPEGSVLGEWRRHADWFPQRENPAEWSRGDPATPPTPIVAAAWEGEEGQLWVFVHVPRSDWRAAWTPEIVEARRGRPDGTGGVGETTRQLTPSAHSLYDTAVEILDLDQERVVARGLIREYVVGALGDARVATYHEDERGEPVVRILDLQLRN